MRFLDISLSFVNLLLKMQVDGQAGVRVSTKEFSTKFRSLREIHVFLSVDVKAYLPQPDTINIYFLKQLVLGQKKRKSLFFILSCMQISNQIM